MRLLESGETRSAVTADRDEDQSKGSVGSGTELRLIGS